LIPPSTPSAPAKQSNGTKSPTPAGTLTNVSPSLIPTLTPSQESETSYLRAILSGVKIVDEPDQLVFLDSNDEILWMIEDRFSGLTFDRSGCFLLNGWYRDQYAELTKLSLKGQVLETKSVTYDEKHKAPDGTAMYFPSPSGDFLAYMVGSGMAGMGPADWEFLDAGLIDFRKNRSSTPIMLTSHGGVSRSGPIWSSDGRYLAFSDFDENGIVQILVYGIEEEQVSQLTNFGEEMRNWHIVNLIWSHDDTMIAFAAGRNEEEQSTNYSDGILGVISKTQGSLLWVSPPTKKGYLNLYWEHDNLHLLAIRGLPGHEVLVNFDGETGEELEVLGPLLNEINKSERKKIVRRFIMPTLIGYLYETQDGIFYPSSNDDTILLIRDLLLPPQGPVDLGQCPAETFR
jgi:hypothetical protein